ncbi:hypothetical protein [Acinetobacter pittii]|uniref:hypothetical protein n=1 Tax=Acinetobacter pittii TaxID=48296 RepID=UPI001D193145|nr:hypothetical protein [Acinetobacter pittii]MEC6390401.1 hypothetical protein [Acinetobacter pittii]WHA54056.1 hypothetical protein OH685_12425 [Acinetobacter pittii]
MNKVIIFLLIIGMTKSVFAGTVPRITEEEHEKKCIQIAQLAQLFMTTRQNGAPILEALEIVDKAFKEKEDKDLIKDIVRDAYAQPTYTAPSIKKDQVNEFTAKHYLACSGY